MENISNKLKNVINKINELNSNVDLIAYWESGEDYGVENADTIIVVDNNANGDIVAECDNEEKLIEILSKKFNIN